VERLRLAERDNQIEFAFLMGLNAIAAVSSAGVVSVGASRSTGAADPGAGSGGKKGKKKKDKSLSGAAGSPGASQRSSEQPAAAQVSAAAGRVGCRAAGGWRAARCGCCSGGCWCGESLGGCGSIVGDVLQPVLASSGCQYAANSGGRACRSAHQIPARASPDYALMAAR
jgi:hypothetical protein